MLKIGPKFERNVKQYFTKNTVRAKYDRNMDAATVSGLVAFGEAFNFMSNPQPHDIAILAGSLTVYFKTAGTALKHLIELQPIRKRAIKIKKATQKK